MKAALCEVQMASSLELVLSIHCKAALDLGQTALMAVNVRGISPGGCSTRTSSTRTNNHHIMLVMLLDIFHCFVTSAISECHESALD